jgi:hypothetical protein
VIGVSRVSGLELWWTIPAVCAAIVGALNVWDALSELHAYQPDGNPAADEVALIYARGTLWAGLALLVIKVFMVFIGVIALFTPPSPVVHPKGGYTGAGNAIVYFLISIAWILLVHAVIVYFVRKQAVLAYDRRLRKREG